MTIEQMLINQGIAKGRVEGLEQGLERGLERGRVENAASAVLRVLAKRGVPVSDDVRARVNACANLEELEGMLDRALDVARAEELFTN